MIGLRAKGRDTPTHPSRPSASHGALLPFTVTLAGDCDSIRMDDFGPTLLHGSQRQTMFH